jgi:hypothetical protein
MKNNSDVWNVFDLLRLDGLDKRNRLGTTDTSPSSGTAHQEVSNVLWLVQIRKAHGHVLVGHERQPQEGQMVLQVLTHLQVLHQGDTEIFQMLSRTDS